MQKYFYKIILISFFFVFSMSVKAEKLSKSVIMGFNIGKCIYYSGLINQYYKYTMYDFTPPKSVYGGSKPNAPRYDGMQWEFSCAYILDKYIFNLEGGIGNINWTGLQYNRNEINKYISSGYNIKYGIDYNFLKSTPEHNAAFLGFRHALSFFQDSLESYIACDISKEYLYYTKRVENYYKKDGLLQEVKIKQKNLISSWFEVVAGVKIKIFKYIYLSNDLRFKFSLVIVNDNKIRPFDIIGYGLTNDISQYVVFGYNFYLSFLLPIKTNTLYKRTIVKSNNISIF